MQEQVTLRFEGLVVYSVGDAEEGAHFFEHTLGLQPAAADGALRLYPLSETMTLALDVSGEAAGDAPYLVFSARDLTAAAEHFLGLGCHVRELPWATGSGFLARSPEGRVVCVVEEAALE